MNVKQVRVAFGATVNTGNFNSLRFDVEMVADLEPGDEVEPTLALLHERCADEVRRQARARRGEGNG